MFSRVKKWAKGVWLAILGRKIIASGISEWRANMGSNDGLGEAI